MTTKQEIIEFINCNNAVDGGIRVGPGESEYESGSYYDNEDGCTALIQMIKDLKPEIKVKKLVWHKYEDYFWYTYLYKLGCDDDFYVKCKIYPPYKSKEGFTVSYSIRGLESERRHFPILEEAQGYVQNLQDEYVLSLVEVKPESLPNGWADIKDPDKWLHENGFRTELEGE